MGGTTVEWLEGQLERVSTRQRAQVETAKLLATFSTAVSASLVATGLQVDPATRSDLIALCLLALSFSLALAVVLADRLAEADHNSVLTTAALLGWTDDQTVAELRTAVVAATEFNATVVKAVRAVLYVQLLFSAGAAAISAAPLAL